MTKQVEQMTISLLTPTRQRPEVFERMVKSAFLTAIRPDLLEVVAYLDDDDATRMEYPQQTGSVRYVVGPRIRKITQAWNECFEVCCGEVVCQANDDIVFITRGWDEMVRVAFEEVEDRILMVHGSDVFGHCGRFGPHPFVSRRWVEALGYFIPPYFSSDYGDAWVNDLANLIGRRRYLPFEVEHHHFSYGMCEPDENTKERLARHTEDDPDRTYNETLGERHRDAGKLQDLMFSDPDVSQWIPPGSDALRSVGRCPRCKSFSTIHVANGKNWCNGCGFEYERPPARAGR